MSRRLAPVLLSIVFSFSCASFPDLPVAPIVNFDSFPIVGAARINYEAVDPEEQEILQPAAVSISARGESVGGILIRLALRPGEAEVIRLKPGFYEYEISGARKAPQKGSFEIRPPDKMLFELTLSLNLPVRQAYLWHSVGQKHNTTLHHPTVPITILSDSPQKLRFFARAAQGYRYRAPKPLSRCPEEPEEPEEQLLRIRLRRCWGIWWETWQGRTTTSARLAQSKRIVTGLESLPIGISGWTSFLSRTCGTDSYPTNGSKSQRISSLFLMSRRT